MTRYLVQTNWGSWEEKAHFNQLKDAINCLVTMSNLSRMVCGIRVTDIFGKVFAYYNPENDTRLPGCRWRKISQEAYFLWEDAGKPNGRSQDFWLKAENDLKDSNGIVIEIEEARC